jgi:hypothetical protein
MNKSEEIAQSVAHKYRAFLDNCPSPHVEIKEAFEFLADRAKNRSEAYDLKILAAHIFNFETDEDLRRRAEKVLWR